MCGRFVSSSPPDELAKYFDVDAVAEQVIEPSYNVAPSQDVYVVVESGGSRRLDAFRWGLVPFWAKDPATGYKMINARAESVTDKNAYKRAFQKRRCIIPADGFFEWKKIPGQKAKQPYFIHRSDGEPMAFAGLWEVWRPADDEDRTSEPLRTCTIITGEPNEKVADIHDRMPVMLPPSAWAEWLDPENDDVETLGKFLVPAPATLYALHPVTRAVNNVQEKGPELIDPAEEPLDGVPGQARLL
ncbi:MAG TPA: SOS response-associated peptidase [Acidimicrobiales bacterium]|nr:SOS response-associated peptidase [Acidimicrobiales bacterium]